MEKITEQIKLHLPESMLRDVQDCAMVDDRKVSEWIRHVHFVYLYGCKPLSCADKCDVTMRGDAGRTE